MKKQEIKTSKEEKKAGLKRIERKHFAKKGENEPFKLQSANHNKPRRGRFGIFQTTCRTAQSLLQDR